VRIVSRSSILDREGIRETSLLSRRDLIRVPVYGVSTPSLALRLVLGKLLGDYTHELIYEVPFLLLSSLLPVGSDVLEVHILRSNVLLVSEEANQFIRFGTLAQVLAVFEVVASRDKI